MKSGSSLDPASGALVLPRLEFSDRTLANGLRVIGLEDHRTPTVAINVAYRVGGKDDPPGRSGFAHLFEHLMFKGTEDTRPQTIDRLTEDVGGFNNAYTAEDLTNYYEVVPSHYLETLLWAEADRLASLAVDEANFHTERDVVIGEYDQRILADPYGMLGELAQREAYTEHPYRRGVIGDPDNLRAATLDDVLAFHATYYRPDNAVLVVAGDFDPAQFERWVDAYFAPIPRPAQPIPRVRAVEPAQQAERRLTHAARNAPLPAIHIAYHIPAASSPDVPALDLAEILLGSGRSARLYRSLVYQQRIASTAFASSDPREQPGLFELRAIASTGHTVRELEQSLSAEIARLRDEPPAEAEVEKAKTQLLSMIVRGRQTNNDLALALSRSAIVRGDPNVLNDEIVHYQAVRPEDITRVAREYLLDTNRTVIEYLAGASEAAA